METVKLAGQKAITAAEAEWKSLVVDPAVGTQTVNAFHFGRISTYYSDGLGWTWDLPYPGNKMGREWCGAFAMWCWAQAGLKLKPWRYTFGASTERLDAFGAYRPWRTKKGQVANPPQPGAQGRVYLPCDFHSTPELLEKADIVPQPGDILLVGAGDRHWGTHIVLVREYNASLGRFATTGGNGHGMLSNGRLGEGVVHADFCLGGGKYRYHVRRLIRPAATDLE